MRLFGPAMKYRKTARIHNRASCSQDKEQIMEINDELVAEIEQVLNLALGMVLAHAPDQQPRVLDVATRLTDEINNQPSP